MKIRVVLEIEIDPQEWEDAAGCERSEVRNDVKTYIRNTVQASAMIDEADGQVTLR